MRCVRSCFTAMVLVVMYGCGGAAGVNNALPTTAMPSANNTGSLSYTLTGGAQTVALPNLSVCHGTVSLPAASSFPLATALTLTTSVTAPAGVAPLANKIRPAAAGRLDILCYVTFSVSKPLTFSTVPGFSVSVGSNVSTGAPREFFYAISQPANAGATMSYRTEGPASVSGQTLTFASSPDALELAARQPYVFAFYSTSALAQSATRLYVETQNQTIKVYDLTNGNAPLSTISGGLKNPGPMVVDAGGKLYVSDGALIRIFDTTNGNAPLAPIDGGPSTVFAGLAIDAAKRLYAANTDTYPGSIRIFDTTRGNAELPAITDSTLFTPSAVSIDPNGKLYVLRGTNEPAPGSIPVGVSVFDTRRNDVALPSIKLDPLLNQDDLAVSPSGFLYISNFGGNISVFDIANDNAPLADVLAQYDPTAVKADLGGKLYVSVSEQSSASKPLWDIDVFDAAHANVKVTTIRTGVSFVSHIAVH